MPERAALVRRLVGVHDAHLQALSQEIEEEKVEERDFRGVVRRVKERELTGLKPKVVRYIVNKRKNGIIKQKTKENRNEKKILYPKRSEDPKDQKDRKDRRDQGDRKDQEDQRDQGDQKDPRYRR